MQYICIRLYRYLRVLLYFRRNVKRAVLPPESLSERKKNSRKKKLFIPGDDSFQDIEPLEVNFLNLNMLRY